MGSRLVIRRWMLAELCALARRGVRASPARVMFRYDTRAPFAITLTFETASASWVGRTFARELLSDGLI